MKRRKETLEEYNDRRDAEARARQEEIKEPESQDIYAKEVTKLEAFRPKPRLPGAQGRAAKGKT